MSSANPSSTPSEPSAALDLTVGPVDLTEALCNIESVSGDEKRIADAVETALRAYSHLEVTRLGNNVVARTNLGRESRVVIAGHLDTVPIAQNLPVQRIVKDGKECLWGRGTVDMKGGAAVQLVLAAELNRPNQDVTWCFYENEEVDSELNGLGIIARTKPDLLEGDFAILCEPSSAGIEGGCNGTLRVIVTTKGIAAHSARAWMGENAIHAAAPILARLAAYEPQTVTVDGLDYRESMNAVSITGGIAGNVIPDHCEVKVNYRFAPSHTPDEALAHVRELFAGFNVEVDDIAPGARPGLDSPRAQDFARVVLERSGTQPAPKYGWTDVARFAELGLPAVNFGPGNAIYAHRDDEHCPTDQIQTCYEVLKSWLK